MLNRNSGDIILEVRVNRVQRRDGSGELIEQSYREKGEKFNFRTKIDRGNVKPLVQTLQSLARNWDEVMGKSNLSNKNAKLSNNNYEQKTKENC